MVQIPDDGTLVPGGTLRADPSQCGTLVELSSDLGTMVINSDVDEQTMRRHDTGSAQKIYRPYFMDHFDKKEAEVKQGNGLASPTTLDAPNNNVADTNEEEQRFQSHYHLQMNQVPPTTAPMVMSPVTPSSPLQQHPPPPPIENKANMIRGFSDGDFEFLKFLSYDQLQQRMTTLDAEMEREIDELRRRYQTKRQPILDAMDTKRKRQQNF